MGQSQGQRSRSDGKRGLVQDWIPLRKQERRLVRVRERGPDRTLLRGLEQPPLRTQEQRPERKLFCGLMRAQERGLEQ